MEYLTILAQATTNSANNIQYVPMDYFWKQITTLSWLQAVIAVSFGAVYLLYGWRIFKILVVICFALVGLFAGIKLGSQYTNMTVWGGLIGFCLLAAISVPLMRWAVSILGAIAGGILTGGIWYAAELPEKYILAGIIIGVVAGGMISFIVYKIAVMLFTSFGGSILIVTGMLSLFYHYENTLNPPTTNTNEMFYSHHWFLPACLLLPTIIGIIVQNKLIKGSKDWSV